MYRKVLALLAAAAILYGCAGQHPKPATEITIEAADFSYSPATIRVPAGQPVTLTIRNTGGMEHDFVIENMAAADVVEAGNGSTEHDMQGMRAEYDLHVSTQKGETSILKFTALQPGTYKFFCTVAGHLEAGMTGELIVE